MYLFIRKQTTKRLVIGVFVGLLLIGVLSTFSTQFVFAHSENIGLSGSEYEEQYNQLQANQAEKARLEAQISDLQNQQLSLVNQLTYLESKAQLTEINISETEASISDTEQKLVELAEGIESLHTKVGVLEESISRLKRAFYARVKSSYEAGFSPAIGVFLASDDFQTAVLRYAYLKNLQEEDNAFLEDLRTTRTEYEDRVTSLEDLKTKQEQAKSDLEGQRALLVEQRSQLAQEKSTKNWILQQTQNEEQNYQVLLAQIEAEISAIQNALSQAGTILGEVQPGDIIGHVGNTGCSTGPHLHFGYYINGVAVNPKPYMDSGQLAWPLVAPQVTQWYGENYDWYMSVFGLPGHNGIDMVDSAVGYGAPVLAAKAGTAYSVQEANPCYLTGTRGNGVRIDHADGTKTIYWHLQS